MAKKAYIGVDGVAKKVKKGYVGVDTEVPIYKDETTTTNITADNISVVFDVYHGSHGFYGSGSTFTSNNKGVKNSTAKTILTAKEDCTVSFTYSYSSETNYDKFTLTVGSVTVESEVSGATTTKNYSCDLPAGERIEFLYVKDNSSDANDDRCTFSNMVVTTVNRTQVGSEVKPLARKIKKAYIGIGGVARPCWSGGELAYYGTIDPIGRAVMSLGAATVGDYAVIGGGLTTTKESASVTLTAYNTSLTKNTSASLNTALVNPQTASTGNYAIFAGGESGDGDYVRDVTAVDEALTRTVPDSLSFNRKDGCGVSFNGYAVIVGGRSATNLFCLDAHVYDSELTHSRKNDIHSVGHGYTSAAVVGDYVIVGGGYLNYNTATDVVDAFDKSFTRTTIAPLAAGDYHVKSASTGKHAVIGNGAYSATVCVYDDSLTKIRSAMAITGAGSYGAASEVGGYIVFAGGRVASGYTTVATAGVDAFDENLTRTQQPALSQARSHLTGVTVGNCAIFAGGTTGTNYKNGVTTAEAFVVA